MIPPTPMGGPQTPELAKKMAAIAALREIQNLRMTGKDFSTAVPLLKELREAEKALESRAGEVLEQERRALLAAGPETHVPPTSGERLREANEAYRRQSEKVWESMIQKLGPHIVGGLQRILQGGGTFGPMGPGMPPGSPGGFGPGPGFAPVPGVGGAHQPGLGPRPGFPGQPGHGEVGPPPGFRPQAGQGRPGFPGRPGAQGQGRNVPGAPPQPAGSPSPGGQGPQGVPGFGQPGPGPMMFPGPMMGGGVRLSLAELIDLLEQKRAAIRG